MTGAEAADGMLQYSQDGGLTWYAVGEVSDFGRAAAFGETRKTACGSCPIRDLSARSTTSLRSADGTEPRGSSA